MEAFEQALLVIDEKGRWRPEMIEGLTKYRRSSGEPMER
jgi:hypothetical protein